MITYIYRTEIIIYREEVGSCLINTRIIILVYDDHPEEEWIPNIFLYWDSMYLLPRQVCKVFFMEDKVLSVSGLTLVLALFCLTPFM